MSSVSALSAPAKDRKPRKAEINRQASVLSPSNPKYYEQQINSPSFEARKHDVIKGLVAHYWMNKALKKLAKKT